MTKRKNLPVSVMLESAAVVERFHAVGLTDLGTGWLKNQADRGMIPYVVVARKRRYREDLIEQMIQDWSDAAA